MKTAKWIKVKNLKTGDKIAVPRDEILSSHWHNNVKDKAISKIEKDIAWEEIVDIKISNPETVYDIEVEGTHNFVAGHIINPETGQKYSAKEEKKILRQCQGGWWQKAQQWLRLFWFRGCQKTRSSEATLNTKAGSATGRYAGIFAHNTYTQGLSVDRNVETQVGNIDISGSYLTNGADYAEYFYTQDEDLEPGDTVCIDVANAGAVKKCAQAGDGNILGIVSSHPSIIGNAGVDQDKSRADNPNYVVVGMLGQIPAKVSTENGAIRPGDSLTSSSIPGHLMRAKAGDPTVGVALESFSAEESNINEIGNIQVLISRKNKSLTVENVEEEVARRIASLEIEDEVEIIIAQAQKNLESKLEDNILTIKANEVGLNDLTKQQEIAKERLVGFNLGLEKMSGQQNKVKNDVDTLAGQVEVLESGSHKLETEIKDVRSELNEVKQTSDINITQLADNLQGLINSLGGLKDVSEKIELMSQSVLSVMESNQALSARLDEVEVMRTELGELITFTPEVVVLTSPEIITEENQDPDAVKQYKTLVLDARSGLEIKAGNFKLDKNGNVEISGNLFLGGDLAVSKISPDGSELVLAPKGEEPKVVVEGDLEVKGKVVLSARDEKVSKGGSEDDGVVPAADDTTGTATITAGETVIHIPNNQVGEDSLIYITPVSRTGGRVLFVSDKRAEDVEDPQDDGDRQGFTVSIEEEFDEDIEFNYWIVD